MLLSETWGWVIQPSPYTNQNKTTLHQLIKAGQRYDESRFAVVGAGGAIIYAVGQQHVVESAPQQAVWWRWQGGELDYVACPTQRHWRIIQRSLSQRGYEPLLVRVVNVRACDVRDVTIDDVIAEGFVRTLDFWGWWCYRYDPEVRLVSMVGRVRPRGAGEYVLWLGDQLTLPDAKPDQVKEILYKRPRARYQAWALEFVFED